jgi:hypothetical protein
VVAKKKMNYERESACENEKLNLKKWFRVLKVVNHFTGIEVDFLSQPKTLLV